MRERAIVVAVLSIPFAFYRKGRPVLSSVQEKWHQTANITWNFRIMTSPSVPNNSHANVTATGSFYILQPRHSNFSNRGQNFVTWFITSSHPHTSHGGTMICQCQKSRFGMAMRLEHEAETSRGELTSVLRMKCCQIIMGNR